MSRTKMPLNSLWLRDAVIFFYAAFTGFSLLHTLPADEPATRKALDRIVLACAAEAAIPGMILRIESADGPVYEKAAGYWTHARQRTTLTSDYFRTASVGKMFTAAAILRLHEKGILKLSDSIAVFLDDGLVNRLHHYAGRNRGGRITIEQLLGHTSGLGNTDEMPAFHDFILSDPARLRKPVELLEYGISAGAKFAPGEGQSYSSPGYFLLGMIIEAATGKAYHEVIREEILSPLGMEHTCEEASECPDDLAVSHSFIGEIDVSAVHPSFEFADGGFLTTVADLTRFGLGLASGKPFEKRETLDNMIRVRGDQEIGLGVFVAKSEEGDTVIYHSGFWGVYLFVYQKAELAVALTVNQSETSPEFGARISQILKLAKALNEYRKP